jgi:hypothetical protein
MNVWMVWYQEEPWSVQEEADCALTLCGIYSTKEGAERGKAELITCDADTHNPRLPDRYFIGKRRLFD